MAIKNMKPTLMVVAVPSSNVIANRTSDAFVLRQRAVISKESADGKISL